MPRPATGTIETHPWADGRTVTYRLRIPYRGRKVRLNLGTNLQGWNEVRARGELERIMGQIARGTWEPPARATATADPEADETLRVFAYRWWTEHKHEWKPRTQDDYRWRLDHLLAEYGDTPVRDIDRRAVDRLRAKLGAEMRPRSANMVLSLLARLLDVAVKYELLPANPAKGRDTRLRQPRPQRSFLEPDMVVDLLDAAGAQETAARASDRYGRRALLALLCIAGPRITEAVEATRGQVDVHAGLWRIPDAKTEAGVRVIELTSFLAAEIREHLAVTALAGRATRPGDPLFPTRTGGRMNVSNVRNRTLRHAVQAANAKRAIQGRLLLPAAVTPHTLRRTFASLCLFAGRDLPFVMGQLGHDDPRMTLSVYAQVLQRRGVDRQQVWDLMRFTDEPDSAQRTDQRPVPGHPLQAVPFAE